MRHLPCLSWVDATFSGELPMSHDSRNEEQVRMIEDQMDPEALKKTHGAPAGARQNVRSDTEQGAVARPGGATQNSGGAIIANDEEQGTEPGRSASWR